MSFQLIAYSFEELSEASQNILEELFISVMLRILEMIVLLPASPCHRW
jgi:hypothetical protein